MSFKLLFLLVTLSVGNFAQDTGISSRIIGGEPSDHVPYMVALTAGYSDRQLICGGSLVTTRHVLTAAHCIDVVSRKGFTFDSLRGHVGTKRYTSGGTTYAFIEGIQHPDFNLTAFKNDIAILVTFSYIQLSDIVNLISLTYSDIFEGGTETTMMGWGRSSLEEDTNSEVLMKLDTVVVEGDICAERIAEQGEKFALDLPDVDPTTEICAYSFIFNRTGGCIADAGGPLVLRDTNEQIGVMSWGIECARGAPNMFARISYYREWIESTIQGGP